MKFNEKLIELRKKAGLSQEELGYKLDVTRQTVSKWELGQTTPEMDKLVEMGRIFGISIDELINATEEVKEENPIVEEKVVKQKGSKEKTMKTVIIIAIIVVIIAIIVKGIAAFAGISIFKNEKDKIEEESKGIFSKVFTLFDKLIDEGMESLEESEEIENQIKETEKEIEKKKFNGVLELYNGTQNSTQVNILLDEVIKKSKTESKSIIVKYLETETEDTEEIKNLKNNISENKNYEVSFEYDEEGYINEVKIEKTVTEFEKTSFNNKFEIFAGTKMGVAVIHVLDEINTNNKTKEQKITVKYLEIETQDEEQIKNIKRDIGNFDQYEVSFEYDEIGFINEVIIEKI